MNNTLKEQISKILVKWDMPTRQVAIDEIVALLSAHDTALVEELGKMKVIELQKPKNSQEALIKAMDWARNETIDATITYIENNKIQ